MVDSDDEYEEDSRGILPPPPKKPASFSVKKSSDYSQEKNPNRTHSTLSNKASRQQKENCNSVSLSSSSFNTTVICSDNTECVQKKKPIESRTLNFDICNSTISNDMGMYIKKTLSLIIKNCHFYILLYCHFYILLY